MGSGGRCRAPVPGSRGSDRFPCGQGAAMGGRNKKQRAGSAARTASAATAAARARAAAEAGAAAAEAGSRAAPRPPPASKEPRVKQGSGPRGVRRPRPGSLGGRLCRGGERCRVRAAAGCRGWPGAHGGAASSGSSRGRGLLLPVGPGAAGLRGRRLKSPRLGVGQAWL